MLLFVITFSYSNFPAKPSNDNSLDEPSATTGYEIPMTPSPAYDTTQVTFNQSLENPHAYVPAKPSNDNTLDESSATAGYVIPMTPCTAYDTTQFKLLVG